MAVMGAAAAALAWAGSASATTVFADNAGLFDWTKVTITGTADAKTFKETVATSAMHFQTAASDGGATSDLWTFCVDIFRTIGAGLNTFHDVDITYTSVPFATDGGGGALTLSQQGQIGGLANLGQSLISTSASDLGDKLAEIQLAIWRIEYPSLTFTVGDSVPAKGVLDSEAADINAGANAYVTMAQSSGFKTAFNSELVDDSGKNQG
ncbi:MAG: hypothetical protein ACREQ5_24515, partial [Candidatus Dormibacteria bacterium]